MGLAFSMQGTSPTAQNAAAIWWGSELAQGQSRICCMMRSVKTKSCAGHWDRASPDAQRRKTHGPVSSSFASAFAKASADRSEDARLGTRAPGTTARTPSATCLPANGRQTNEVVESATG